MSQASPSIDHRLALSAHAAGKGEEIHAKYGPALEWRELQQLLQDRALVRYPTEIVFAAGPLLPGELAHPVANGVRPEEGFTLYVHPSFAQEPRRAVYAIFYQLVVINYGPFASAEAAEVFGASALGISREAYYQALCDMADGISPPTST